MNAIDFAIKYHGNQKYNGKPYSYHLEGVAKKARELWTYHNGTSEDDKLEVVEIVAILHDILEDTDCTLPIIYKVFGKEVYYNVQCLTHEPECQSYLEYIVSLKDKYIASVIKEADLQFNLAHIPDNPTGRWKHMRDKYEMALHILTN